MRARTPTVTITCFCCGKPFDVKPWEVKRGRRFCSLSCRNRHFHKGRLKNPESVKKMRATKLGFAPTEEHVRTLFEDFTESGLSLNAYCKKIHRTARTLIRLFKEFIPEEYETFTRKQVRFEPTEEEVRKLLEGYRKTHLPMRIFAGSVEHNHKILVREFKRCFPDEYADIVEIKLKSNKLYEKGRRFEYRVRDHLQEKGYFVLRSPRSGGPADLVALKRGEILLIQCKMNGYLPSDEEKQLIALTKSLGAKAILAYRKREPKRPMVLRTL